MSMNNLEENVDDILKDVQQYKNVANKHKF